jgi:FKBP-type peptidyl-prolyl cis-trans isomerase SlyD
MARSNRASHPTGSQIGPGTVVALSYELYDGEGELVEASHPATPLVFVSGYGQVEPALEVALSGLVAGQARRVRLEPEEAFGNRDPAAIIEVSRDELPPDIAVGDELDAERDDRGLVTLKVLEVTDSQVVLDANHPLAGQVVELDVVVEEVRPARREELAAAEAALEAEARRDMQALLPADRLLKRGLRENPPPGASGGS